MLNFQILQIAVCKTLRKSVFWGQIWGQNAPAGVFGASKNLVMSDSGFCINPISGEYH
jgi:hypothetical protein